MEDLSKLSDAIDYIRSPESLCSILHKPKATLRELLGTDDKSNRMANLEESARKGWPEGQDFSRLFQAIDELRLKRGFGLYRFLCDCYGLTQREFETLVKWMGILRRLL